MRHPVCAVLDRLAVTPTTYRRLTYAALAALTLIILTGAAVRLTGSGLGCPDWPRCYGHAYPPFSTHALIEFGNRAISGLVGVLTVVVAVLSFTRRPFRRDLALLSLTLPLGVIAQAVLGGFTVREHLAPGFVMAHFSLSMLILIGAFALAWRARSERTAPVTADGAAPAAADGAAAATADHAVTWATRALLPLGALTIVAGTGATAAGPHAGGSPGQRIHRLTFKGADTLQWMVHEHATIAAIFGVAVIAVWLLARRQNAGSRVLEPLTCLGVLLAAQGLIGSVQYELRLPTDIVWVHVVLATLSWLSLLWAVAAAGQSRPSQAGRSNESQSRTARRQLLPVVEEPVEILVPTTQRPEISPPAPARRRPLWPGRPASS